MPGEPLALPANGLVNRVWCWRSDGARPVVLVHGITNSGRGWDFVARALYPEHEVYAVDLRGHGESDKPERGYAVRDYAADLIGILEGLGLERPALVGHSLGGAVAARVAAERPDLLGRLVLVDPAVRRWDSPETRQSMENFLEQVRATRDGGAEAVRRASPHWTDEQVERRVLNHTRLSDRVLLDVIESPEPGSIFDDLPRIAVPTLLLHGDVDHPGPGSKGIVSRETADRFAELLPDGRVAAVPGTGHMMPWDDMDGFMRPLRAFLSQPG